jgi:thiol:disulfide interchange protein DsbC
MNELAGFYTASAREIYPVIEVDAGLGRHRRHPEGQLRGRPPRLFRFRQRRCRRAASIAAARATGQCHYRAGGVMQFISRLARALPFALVAAFGAAAAQTDPPVAVAAAAPPRARESGAEADLLRRLREAFPASRIDSVATTPVDGVFEVVAGPNVFYTDNSGRYVMFGKLFDMQTRTDITAARLRSPAPRRVDSDDANAINVRGNGKRVLYVFADPTAATARSRKTLQDVNDVTIYTYLVPLLGPIPREGGDLVRVRPRQGVDRLDAPRRHPKAAPTAAMTRRRQHRPEQEGRHA